MRTIGNIVEFEMSIAVGKGLGVGAHYIDNCSHKRITVARRTDSTLYCLAVLLDTSLGLHYIDKASVNIISQRMTAYDDLHGPVDSCPLETTGRAIALHVLIGEKHLIDTHLLQTLEYGWQRLVVEVHCDGFLALGGLGLGNSRRQPNQYQGNDCTKNQSFFHKYTLVVTSIYQ